MHLSIYGLCVPCVESDPSCARELLGNGSKRPTPAYEHGANGCARQRVKVEFVSQRDRRSVLRMHNRDEKQGLDGGPRVAQNRAHGLVGETPTLMVGVDEPTHFETACRRREGSQLHTDLAHQFTLVLNCDREHIIHTTQLCLSCSQFELPHGGSARALRPRSVSADVGA